MHGITRHISLLALAAALAIGVSGAEEAKPAAEWKPDDPLTSARTQWYRDAKFGMFIHWGLYAVPAGTYQGKPVSGIGEWIMNRAKIPIPEYEKFAEQLNPVKFDARAWARLARDAGMKYLVITSKHHDGFSMFDTKVNDYNIVRATPFQRDPMKELSEACRAEGIKFCFYYSIMDWHHPDANAEGADRYIPQMKEQLRELVTRYDPAILWFDGEWVPWWTQERGRDLVQFLHALKPDIVINNRVGKRKLDDGDYETPEQEIPKAAMGKRLWETCMTLNDTWGFKRDDHHWKPPADVIRKLADIASKGGNFLLNVGPDAEGVIPGESAKILEEVGGWLKENGEAIYGTTYSPLPAPSWGRVTRKGSRLYLIVFNWPAAGQPLRLDLRNPVRKAALLAGGAPVRAQAADDGVLLFPPEKAPSQHASVITVDFEGELQAVRSLAERTAAGEPMPVSPDGSIALPAAGAKLVGKTIQFEQKDENGNIGFWSDAKDYVEWFVQPKAPGKFDVELSFACETGSGGDFTLDAGGEKLAGRAAPTGGWTSWRTVKLGTVTLPKEKVTVTLRPTGALTFALMNLRSIRFVPAP